MTGLGNVDGFKVFTQVFVWPGFSLIILGLYQEKNSTRTMEFHIMYKINQSTTIRNELTHLVRKIQKKERKSRLSQQILDGFNKRSIFLLKSVYLLHTCQVLRTLQNSTNHSEKNGSLNIYYFQFILFLY